MAKLKLHKDKIGDESAVPVLAGLLADEKLSAYARDTLEAIPGPASDTALREALSRLQGERLIGVLASIGARRDAQAIDAVAELLGNDDASVAAAAARAPGYIEHPRQPPQHDWNETFTTANQ